jgi:hypothetical protein
MVHDGCRPQPEPLHESIQTRKIRRAAFGCQLLRLQRSHYSTLYSVTHALACPTLSDRRDYQVGRSLASGEAAIVF